MDPVESSLTDWHKNFSYVENINIFGYLGAWGGGGGANK